MPDPNRGRGLEDPTGEAFKFKNNPRVPLSPRMGSCVWPQCRRGLPRALPSGGGGTGHRLTFSGLGFFSGKASAIQWSRLSLDRCRSASVWFIWTRTPQGGGDGLVPIDDSKSGV